MEQILGSLHVILCFIVGTGLLITEVFLPGFGVAGIAGIILEAAAIAMAWVGMGPVAALVVTILAVAVLGVTISLSLRSIAKGKLNSKLVLKDTEKPEDEGEEVFVGKTGTVVSDLRPTGMGDFDGVRLNVMTSGDYVEKGAEIVIVSAQGSRIVVKRK